MHTTASSEVQSDRCVVINGNSAVKRHNNPIMQRYLGEGRKEAPWSTFTARSDELKHSNHIDVDPSYTIDEKENLLAGIGAHLVE